MGLSSKDITTLAIGLAAGELTESAIEDQFGDGVLTQVLAIGAGFGVSAIVDDLLEDSPLDDVFDTVDDFFGGIF